MGAPLHRPPTRPPTHTPCAIQYSIPSLSGLGEAVQTARAIVEMGTVLFYYCTVLQAGASSGVATAT